MTGKTLATIGSMLVNLNQNKLDKCIFCCTKGSIGEVENDFKKFYNFVPMRLDSNDAVVEFFNSDKKIALTRYEWLKYLDENFCKMHILGQNLGMWFDEAHRLKNVDTKIHKQVKIIRPYCKAFHLVTATPIMCNLDDLFGLFELLNPNILGTYNNFCNNFYVRELIPSPRARGRRKNCPTCGSPIRYSNGWDCCLNPFCKSIQIPGGFIPYRQKVLSVWKLIEYKNIELLSKMAQQYMFCYFPEQDINYIPHIVEMSNETKNNYIKVANGSFDNVDEEVPFHVRMTELQYVTDRSQEKQELLYSLANELKEQGFVLYLSLYNTSGLESNHTTLEIVKDVLSQIKDLEVLEYTGNSSDEEKAIAKFNFQNDARNKCIIITDSGNQSLNLQSTNQFIFYDVPFGFGKISQCLGRVVRLFSKFKSFDVHLLQCSDSIDYYKFEIFKIMSSIIYQLMNNKLISLNKPIDYNAYLKDSMRNSFCWKKN